MDRIGRYEIRRELGRGGYGRVYAAFDPVVARSVAVKTLTALSEPGLLARFRNEASAAGQLRHPNIVTIYDFDEYEGSPFLVMELLEGEDLQHVISSGRELSVYDKVRILCEVADGLQHAHSNGILHRDIKPANIMLLRDGHIKILDFGIALVTQTALSRLTGPGYLIGTYQYMAPEQFHDAGADTRAEVFSYGVVCYELLTGIYPFRAADNATVMYRIVNRDPVPLSRHAPECPPALEGIVARALSKDRLARYQSVDEMKFDLEPILLDLRKQRASVVAIEAEARFASDDLTAAHSLVREALELDSGSVVARSLREQIQREIQRRAVRPRVAALLETAECKLSQRSFQDAIRDLEAALSLDTTNQIVIEKLSMARASLEVLRRGHDLAVEARQALADRNLTGALALVRKALIADPDNTEVGAVLEQIWAEWARQNQSRESVKPNPARRPETPRDRVDSAATEGPIAAADRPWVSESIDPEATFRFDVPLRNESKPATLREARPGRVRLRASAATLFAVGTLVAGASAMAILTAVPGDVPPLPPQLGTPPAPALIQTSQAPLQAGTRGTLVMRTGVPGVEISLNRRICGRTDAQGSLSVDLPAGRYQVRAHRNGYTSGDPLTVELKSGVTKEVVIAVRPRGAATPVIRQPMRIPESGSARAVPVHGAAAGLPELPAMISGPQALQPPVAPRQEHLWPPAQPSPAASLVQPKKPEPAKIQSESTKDREAITRLLRVYEQAFEKRRIQDLEAIWPGMPLEVRENFRRALKDGNVQYTIRLTPLKAPEIAGDSAWVDCERAGRTIANGVARPVQVTRVRVSLVRTADRWLVTGIRTQS